jgi:hypothetical protein
MSALTTYKEAISELINAVNALDQAHSLLRDIDLHHYIDTAYGARRHNVHDAVNIADELLRQLQNVECPECGNPMAESEDCLSGCCPELVGHVNG